MSHGQLKYPNRAKKGQYLLAIRSYSGHDGWFQHVLIWRFHCIATFILGFLIFNFRSSSTVFPRGKRHIGTAALPKTADISKRNLATKYYGSLNTHNE